MKYSYQIGNATHVVQLERTSDGYRAVLHGHEFEIRVIMSRHGEIRVQVGGKPVTAYWALDGQRRWVFIDGHTYVLSSTTVGSDRKRGTGAKSHAADKIIRAPMPGQVRAVTVAEGDDVAKGQTLIVLEAMKMEIKLQAPQPGKMVHVSVQVGEQVERDQVLGEIA